MSLRLIQVNQPEQIQRVSTLAHTIWQQHFTALIGSAQVDYMLEKFQSPHAIQTQLATEYHYLLAQSGVADVGYAAFVEQGEIFFISKLYTHASVRGSGVGKALLDALQQACVARQLNKIQLVVNKHNSGPIAWYRRQGFQVVEAKTVAIGGGFFMDDYLMEKPL